MFYKKIITHLSILFFLISSSYAQQISMEEVLRSVANDEKIANNNALKIFAAGLNYKLPFMRKIDVRVGINGNLTGDTLDGGLRNEDYFALNLATNNWKEMRLQKAIQPAQINVYSTENQVFLQQALYERYQSLAAIYFAKLLFDKRIELLNSINSKTEILKTTLEQGEVIKVKDIVDIENDKNIATKFLLEYETTSLFNRQKVKNFLQGKDFDTIDYQKFITVDEIENNINALRITTTISHPSLRLRQAQRDLSEAELKYENVRDRQIFNFLQIGYDNYAYQPTALRRFNPQNNFTIRVGLLYPLPSNNNLKRSVAALQLKEDEQAVGLNEKLLQKNIDNQLSKMDNLIKNYRRLEKNRTESVVQKLLTNQTLLQQISPLEVLEMKISIAKLNIQSLEIYAEICNEYLRYLDLTGNMSKFEDKNFLARP
jgi:hypothetical protein